jgi:hypothetical protein
MPLFCFVFIIHLLAPSHCLIVIITLTAAASAAAAAAAAAAADDDDDEMTTSPPPPLLPDGMRIVHRRGLHVQQLKTMPADIIHNNLSQPFPDLIPEWTSQVCPCNSPPLRHLARRSSQRHLPFVLFILLPLILGLLAYLIISATGARPFSPHFSATHSQHFTRNPSTRPNFLQVTLSVLFLF